MVTFKPLISQQKEISVCLSFILCLNCRTVGVSAVVQCELNNYKPASHPCMIQSEFSQVFVYSEPIEIVWR